MRSGMLTVIMLAVGLAAGLSGAALTMEGQVTAIGQGGVTDRVGQRPMRPPQPGPQGRGPVRDPRQPPAEGTATIRGRVVDGITGQAIPRAKVRTMGGRDPRSARVATTDAEGVFTLTKVPSGSLMLMAEKATYLQGMYPDRRRTMRGSNLNVAEGQTIDNVNLQLFRGGAITGRVVDAYGDPVENAMVQAILMPQSNRSLSPGRGGMRSSQSTNDIGEFRLGRLEPGQYYLLAMPQRRGNMEEDGSSASGRTWYPGVASIEQAQPVTLERGSSVGNIDFQMLETTLTKVSGFVLTAKGTPAKGGHVTVRTTNITKGLPSGWFGGGSDNGGAAIDQNGNFDVMLQPGDYVIEAMAPQGDEGPRQGRFEMDRGQVKLSVGGEAISGVTITTGGGGTITGRFVFKGTSAPPTSFAGFNVFFSGPNATMGEDCRSFSRSTVNPDGTFSAENMWGACTVRGSGQAKGWTFESVMHNGNDITSRAIELGAGRSISGVEIVYSDRIGEITPTVADESGQPTQDYVTIAFPVEKEKWIDQRFLRTQVMTAPSPAAAGAIPGGAAAGLTGSRVVMSNATESSQFAFGMGGGNALRNMLAGDYFVVAVEDANYADLMDPEYLERLSQMATRVTLSAGETQSVQLRRVKAPE